MSQNYMSNDDSVEVLGAYASGINNATPVVVTYEQWVQLTPEQQNSGNYIVKNYPSGGIVPQSDWNQTNPSADDYIKNKPDVEGMITALFDSLVTGTTVINKDIVGNITSIVQTVSYPIAGVSTTVFSTSDGSKIITTTIVPDTGDINYIKTTTITNSANDITIAESYSTVAKESET